MFNFKTFSPHYKLQKWVKSYWIVDYKKIDTNKIQKKIITPYDNICLLFVINNSKEKICNSNFPYSNGIYVSPPSMDIQTLVLNSDMYYIDVSLYTGVFYKLFGIPISELENRLYNIEELSLKFDLSILEILHDLKGNVSGTINCLNNYLFDIFENFQEDSLLNNLFQLTKNYNLDEFYLQNRLSIRQVQRKVKEFTGMNPKDIQRINKFYHTLTTIKTNKNFLDFGNIASENNYYDQSYFIKEFKSFTGLTPKHFLENAENFLQYKCNIFS